MLDGLLFSDAEIFKPSTHFWFTSLRRREISRIGKIQVRSEGAEEVVDADVATLIKGLLNRQSTIKENLRTVEVSRRAVQQANRKLQNQKIATRVHGITREAADGDQLDEPMADLLESLHQRRTELETAEADLEQNTSLQRIKEGYLFTTIRSSDAQLSPATRKALRAVVEGRTSLKIQRKQLERLNVDLNTIRNNARRALYELGFKHFEDDLQSALQRITEAKTSVSQLDSAVQNSLSALYSSMAQDVYNTVGKASKDDKGDEGNPEPNPGPKKSQEALDKLEMRYEKACKNLTLRWRDHFWHYDQYSKRLSEEIAKAIEEYRAELDHRADNVRAAAGAQYFSDWLDEIKRIRELEDVFRTRRKAAMLEGLRQRGMQSEFMDVITCPDSVPNDGKTESMAPSAIQCDHQYYVERLPFVEGWIHDTQADSSHAILMPPLEPVSDDFWPDNDGDITPWDSISLTERLPGRRRRIDDYQRNTLDLMV